MIIDARGRIGRNRSVTRGAKGIVMNVERRHVAHEGPCRLMDRGESADRQRPDRCRSRYAKRCAGAIFCRDDAGEALLDALAVFAARIAAKVVFVYGLCFRKLAAFLMRKT